MLKIKTGIIKNTIFMMPESFCVQFKRFCVQFKRDIILRL